MKKKVIELTIEDFDVNGVNAISLVDEPAMEEYFLKFSDEKYNMTLARVDVEKRIITGPALVPDKEIYRFDEKTGEEYYVYFTADTIEKILLRYLLEKKQDSVTVDHKDFIDGVYMFESWLVRNPENDAANELGYKVPTGTLMVSMKVDNDTIWDLIKNGNLKGFSIEGMFAGKFSSYKFSEDEDIEKQIKEILMCDDLDEDQKIEKINSILKKVE